MLFLFVHLHPRPGDHSIQSAVAQLAVVVIARYPEVDVATGGQDLIFPHHENEIAQSEALTGNRPFATHWVHNGLLQLGEDKMSKSLGNLVSVKFWTCFT